MIEDGVGVLMSGGVAGPPYRRCTNGMHWYEKARGGVDVSMEKGVARALSGDTRAGLPIENYRRWRGRINEGRRGKGLPGDIPTGCARRDDSRERESC